MCTCTSNHSHLPGYMFTRPLPSQRYTLPLAAPMHCRITFLLTAAGALIGSVQRPRLKTKRLAHHDHHRHDYHHR